MSLRIKLATLQIFRKKNGMYALLNYMAYLLFRRMRLIALYISNVFLENTRKIIEKQYATNNDLFNNRILKDKHDNSRVLVLATGPSLKSMSTLIEWNESIIAINETFYFLKEKGIVPAYTILNDEVYFIKEKYSTFLYDLLECSTNMAMCLLFPLSQKKVIEEMVTQNKFKPKVNYFYTHLGIQECHNSNEYDEFDFSTALPAFPTVTHAAICFALYLGFSKIYLLGVDMDYVFNPGKPIEHGYNHKTIDSSKPRLSCLNEYILSMNWSYKDLLGNTLEQIKFFEFIYKICQRKNVEVYNLSKESYLEVFPHLELEAI